MKTMVGAIGLEPKKAPNEHAPSGPFHWGAIPYEPPLSPSISPEISPECAVVIVGPFIRVIRWPLLPKHMLRKTFHERKAERIRAREQATNPGRTGPGAK